ncbi:MAG: sulfatase-like hydrolase/transferase [Solirubrobacterales bacterium]
MVGSTRPPGCRWIVLGGLLLTGVVSGVSLSGPEAGVAAGPVAGDPTTPVVLIILDELPTSTLMNADGEIDAKRYPEIAGFASQSTWYRDHAAAGDFTAWAIPPILTGNRSNMRTLPTSNAQPHNIFSTFGPGRRVHVHEEVTEMCSKTFCPDGNQNGSQDETDAAEFVKAKFGPIDMPEVNRWIDRMPAGGRTLSVLHLLLPHAPHLYLPNGQTYPFGPFQRTIDGFRENWTVGSAGISLVQQRHMIQAGFADTVVGRVLRKVKTNEAWDRSMVIVTADHGHAFDGRYKRRHVNRGSIASILNPPLMIKYPNQTKGQLSKKSTQATDILPTIAEHLGIRLPYPTDGKPISQVPEFRRMYADRDEMRTIRFTTREIRTQRKELLTQSRRRLGSEGLWKLGPQSHLIGSRPESRKKMDSARFSVDLEGRLAAYRPGDHRVPSLVPGLVTGVRGNRVLVMAMKGKIVATSRSFYYRDAMRFAMMVPPPKLVRSVRMIRLYAVSQSGNLERIARG